MYVQVKDLPESLRAALAQVGYGRADIKIETAETASLFSGGYRGCRSFAILVDLATGRSETHMGSWGGSNMFSPNNSVDNDTKSYILPENGAVITGSEGGDHPTSASICLNPKNVVPWLPAASDVSSEEKAMLAQFRGLKPGYRDTKGKESMIDSLVERGYLKRNKAGATQITTLGKNACEGVRVL